MKEQTFNSLGLKLVVNVPESVAEYDALAKREGACLADAIANSAYRGVMADGRDIFTELLSEATGILRKSKKTGKKTKDDAGVEVDGEVWEESELKFTQRVLSELGEREDVEKGLPLGTTVIDIAKFQPLMDRLSVGGDKEVKLDPSASERGPGKPKKLPEKYAIAAAKFFDGTVHPDSGHPLMHHFKAKHGDKHVSGAEWTPELVGWYIREGDLARQRAAEAKLALASID